MHLVVESGAFEVHAVVESRDNYHVEIPVMNFLQQCAKQGQYAGSVRGLKSLFTRFAEHGKKGLTTEMFHEVDSKHGIWEFIKGDLRVFCFQGGAKAVVLTHGAIKKTLKVDAVNITKAVAARKRYFETHGKMS